MTSMRLSVQSGLLRYYPLDLALRLIRDAGYEGVELWGGQPHGYIHDLVSNGGIDPARVGAVRKACDAAGLEISCYTPEQLLYPNNYLSAEGAPLDGAVMQDRGRQIVRLSIEAAAALGCRRMVLVSPMWLWRRGPDGYRRVSKGEALEAVIAEVESFVRVAEARDVVIQFEALAEGDTNGVVTLEDTAVLLNAIPSPNLEVMLDTGHVAVNARREGIDPVAYFRDHLARFAGRVGYVHVDDNHGDVDSHLVPGAGTIDLRAMLRSLGENGYDGWVSAELAILGEYPLRAEELLVEAHQVMVDLVAPEPRETVVG